MAWGLGIGAGLGLLKSEFLDKPRADIHNKLQAEIERYSPWTGKHGGPIQQVDPFAEAFQAGITGAGVARGLKAPNTSGSLANEGLWGGLMNKNGVPTSSSDLTMPVLGDYALSKSPWYK